MGVANPLTSVLVSVVSFGALLANGVDESFFCFNSKLVEISR